MTEEQQASRGRDPAERQTLEDALKVACEITEIAATGATVDSEHYTLAAGFLVLCGDMAAMLDVAKKATQFCGWCQRANGDSRLGLATYTLEEVREHTVQCQHNPVVQRVVSIADEAFAFRRQAEDEIRSINSELEQVRVQLQGEQRSRALIKERLAALRSIVSDQAEDAGLWFAGTTAPEAYLQQELRRLHAAIEGTRG